MRVAEKKIREVLASKEAMEGGRRKKGGVFIILSRAGQYVNLIQIIRTGIGEQPSLVFQEIETENRYYCLPRRCWWYRS